MNIVVCVKQVPENLSIGLDRDTGYVRRSEAKGTVNQADRHALELGLQLKASAGGNLIALCMGPSGADQALRQALAMGYDEAYLVTDAALAGSDTHATTTVLAAANFSRPSTPGRSQRFQAISGAITITATTGAISGTKVS